MREVFVFWVERVVDPKATHTFGESTTYVQITFFGTIDTLIYKDIAAKDSGKATVASPPYCVGLCSIVSFTNHSIAIITSSDSSDTSSLRRTVGTRAYEGIIAI